MSNDRYSMSFTTGGLFLRESVRTAELYLKLGDWKQVREAIMAHNLLQLRTESSGKRVSRELCARLSQLNHDELALVINGGTQEQKASLWIAVCRQYRFIREFATEVLREKYLTFQYELRHTDFDAFFNAKAAWNEGLDEIADSTRVRLRQALFQIMREAGILSSSNMITPIVPTPRLVKSVGGRDCSEFGVLPVMESEIERCLQ